MTSALKRDVQPFLADVFRHASRIDSREPASNGRSPRAGIMHRLRHDELARLIVVDGVGEMSVRSSSTYDEAVRLRVRRRGEPGRAGSDDDHVERFHKKVKKSLTLLGRDVPPEVVSLWRISAATLKVKITLPRRIRSLSTSNRLSVTFSLFTNVPLRLPMSSMKKPAGVRVMRAWRTEMLPSGTAMAFEASRPIDCSSSTSANAAPRSVVIDAMS